MLWMLLEEYSFQPKMGIVKDGFTEKVPLMPNFEEWIGRMGRIS